MEKDVNYMQITIKIVQGKITEISVNYKLNIEILIGEKIKNKRIKRNI